MHSEQAVVKHAYQGHRCRPSPAPLSGTGKKKGGGGRNEGGPPALAGTREYQQSDRGQ